MGVDFDSSGGEREMIPCVIESPFRGKDKAEESRNRAYLNKLIRWCVMNGYTPYASHKQLVDSLDDSDPEERELGILCGLEMSKQILESHPSARAFFGVDYGRSYGMQNNALPFYEESGFADRVDFVKVGKL